MRILAVVCGLFGVMQIIREIKHRNASVVAKARTLSVEIKPVRDAVSTILYTFEFEKDNKLDTLQHSLTQGHTIYTPLPSMEELRSSDFYLHYIPEHKKSKTPFSDRLYINNSKEIDLPYRFSPFMIMFVLFLTTYLLQPRKKAAAKLGRP